MYLETQGLVLRETNYKEADKILTVLTRDLGKKTIKAPACRRPASRIMAATQLLVYSDMTLFERQERFSLREAAPRAQFWGLRDDLVLLSLASYFAELAEAVAQEGQDQSTLLSLLLNAFYALDTLKKNPAVVKTAFELALLCGSGYEPLLQACAICGAEEPAEPCLHLRAGILHCAACRAKLADGISMPMNATALTAARHIAWGDGKRLFSFRLDTESLRLLSDLCEAFLLTQLERGFRTLDFYKQMTMGQTAEVILSKGTV